MTISRQRKLTAEAFTQKSLVRLPPAVRLTADGLRMFANDHGIGRVELRRMLAELYPETSEITETVLTDHLLMLAEAGVIALYEAGGSSYYEVMIWPKVDRPQSSDYPAAPEFAKPSRTLRESFVARESERESARESEREHESERAGERESEPEDSRISRDSLPPDPFCKEHPDGIEFPCLACQNARLANQHYKDRLRWQLQREYEASKQ